MEKVKIFNINGVKTIGDWHKKFVLSCENDNETIYESKESFRHDVGDGFLFDYKYCVRFADMSEYYENGNIAYELLLVVLPSSLHESQIDSLREQFGKDIKRSDVEIRDVISYLAASVQFGEDFCDSWDDVDSVLTNIANVFETMDGHRGLYLDKVWNANSNDGWDTIRHAVLGKKLF